MKKTVIGTLLISGGLALSQPTLAAGFGVGLMLGQSKDSTLGEVCDDRTDRFNGLVLSASCENSETDTAIGINFSYDLDENFGLEAGYVDLGQTESRFTVTGDYSGTVYEDTVYAFDQQVAYLAATYLISLSEQWSLTGRAGYYDLNGDLASDGDNLGGIDVDPDFYFGGSVGYNFTDRFLAELRYDNFDLHMVSAGLRFKF